MNTQTLSNGDEIKLKPTDNNHIHVQGVITVRGKSQNISAHFHRWTDNNFHLGMENSSPWDRERSCVHTGFGEITPAFRKKAVELLTPAVNEWVKANPESLRQAQLEKIQTAISNRDGQIAEHLKAIEFLRAELAELANGKDLSTYSKIANYHFSMK